MRYLDPISESDRETIYRNFNHTSASVQELIKSIKEWMKKQHHLPETPSDLNIGVFLTIHKFCIEDTKKAIDLYYTLRSKLANMYTYANPTTPTMVEYMKHQNHIPLPKLSNNFTRVSIFQTCPNADLFEHLKSIGINLAITELRLLEDCFIHNQIIMDLKGCKLEHITKTSPTEFRQAGLILRKVFNMRSTNAVYFINCGVILDVLMAFLKVALAPKYISRIKVLKNIEDLYEFIPREILPIDYGGSERSIKELNDELKKTMMYHKSHYDHLDGLKVNETLRLQPFNDDFLGFHGNFRKLEVD